MTEQQILEKVEELARRHLSLEQTLVPEMRLAEDLELDSFRMLTFAVEVENGFEICLSEESEAGIATIGDLVEEIDRQLAAGPRA